MLRRIRADQATLGMYVRKFEGSWLRHPFWRARFVIGSETVLARVRGGEVGLVIDTDKGTDIAVEPAPATAAATPPVVENLALRRLQRQATPAPAPPPMRPMVKVTAPLGFGKADKARATALAQRSSKVVKALFDGARSGGSVATASILSVVDDIATTLEQTSGAFISVTRLKSTDDDTYTHSVAVCALMIGLARETGALPAKVQALGTAGLLHDIGKIAVEDGDAADTRRHPTAGHIMLAAEGALPAEVMEVCLQHHERPDGGGFPQGLAGEEISLAARMATICDAYDTMTSHGGDGRALAPADALAEMEATDGQFDGTLLFKFMRSVNVFSAGKLVRLRSNRLALVLPPVGDDRRPLARAFYATVDPQFIAYEDAVLSERLTDDQAISAEDPDRWFRGDWIAMRAAILAGQPLTAAMIGALPAQDRMRAAG